MAELRSRQGHRLSDLHPLPNRQTKIYLVRHGESQANKHNIYIGHTDMDLTEKGHFQAEKTAGFLSGIHADAIYSSDLKRAYNTALHTATPRNMSVIKSEKLREIFGGDWENIPFDTLVEKYSAEYKIWLENIGVASCVNGESVQQLQNRFVGEVKRIAEENMGKTVFIFTHATPIRVFKAAADGKTLDGMKDVPWATNASVTSAVYENGEFSVVDYSIDGFLGDEITILPPTI